MSYECYLVREDFVEMTCFACERYKFLGKLKFHIVSILYCYSNYNTDMDR